MGALAVIASLLLAIVAASMLAHALPPLPRWPTPEPRPFECVACRVSYRDARSLAQHVGAMHPESYEWASVEAAASAEGDA